MFSEEGDLSYCLLGRPPEVGEESLKQDGRGGCGRSCSKYSTYNTPLGCKGSKFNYS